VNEPILFLELSNTYNCRSYSVRVFLQVASFSWAPSSKSYRHPPTFGEQAPSTQGRGRAVTAEPRPHWTATERDICNRRIGVPVYSSLAPNRRRGLCSAGRDGLRAKRESTLDSCRVAGGTVSPWCTRSVPSGFASVTCHSHNTVYFLTRSPLCLRVPYRNIPQKVLSTPDRHI
jgi:hypothetical protein